MPFTTEDKKQAGGKHLGKNEISEKAEKMHYLVDLNQTALQCKGNNIYIVNMIRYIQ